MACFLCAVLAVVALGAALKVYLKLTTRWNRSYVSLIGKTAIITGANTGIGYYTALDFAKRGARVILACRNQNKAEKALKEILKVTGNQNVVIKLVDMASLQSVRDFAEDINRSEDRLDILVNNAGIAIQSENYTKDGNQTVLQVNHISAFLLTHLLIEKLKKTGRSRIVNVSSIVAKNAPLTVAKLEKFNQALPPTAFISEMYYNSKLCNILFTIELARRLSGTEVTVNALHPGVVYSDFFRDMPSYVQTIAKILGNLYLLTPEEGAQTQIYLSVSNEVEGISGGLFANCKQIGIYKTAKNPDLVQKVWSKTEELAKLRDNEKI
ncbi:hypothetical protein Trydic_g3683 [Trypoxylus dichotomus]